MKKTTTKKTTKRAAAGRGGRRAAAEVVQQRQRRAAASKPEGEDDAFGAAEAFGKALGRTLADLLGGAQHEKAIGTAGMWITEVNGRREPIGAEEVIPHRVTAEPQVARGDAGDRIGGSIGDAILRLLEAVNYSERLTAMLHERLHPVLSAPGPKQERADIATAARRDSVCSAIHEAANRVFADNEQRAALMDRLEI